MNPMKKYHLLGGLVTLGRSDMHTRSWEPWLGDLREIRSSPNSADWWERGRMKPNANLNGSSIGTTTTKDFDARPNKMKDFRREVDWEKGSI